MMAYILFLISSTINSNAILHLTLLGVIGFICICIYFISVHFVYVYFVLYMYIIYTILLNATRSLEKTDLL